MKRAAIITTGIISCIILTGCGTEPVRSPQPFCVTNTDLQAVMACCQAVLGRMNFTIEKADIDNGYIRTYPLTGGQLFEFWRRDNVGGFNTAEANIQTVRRTVELNIDKSDGRLCVECIVTAERMSMPQQEAPSAARAAGMFTKSSRFIQELELNPAQRRDVTWIELGRDGRLEAKILEKLRAKL